MPELNANIPPIECWVRGNYLRDQIDSHDKYFECVIFGVTSMPDRAPLFHFLMEDGGLWWRAPISAFCSRPEAPEMDIHDLVLWNCFSPYIVVTQFSMLKYKKMEYLDRKKKKHTGCYLMTFDWHNPDTNVIDLGWSESPGQHKCGHLIELDNGNYAIQPNNRVLLLDPSFTVKPGELVIERRINTRLWAVEDATKWVTSDDENYMYDVVDRDNTGQ